MAFASDRRGHGGRGARDIPDVRDVPDIPDVPDVPDVRHPEDGQGRVDIDDCAKSGGEQEQSGSIHIEADGSATQLKGNASDDTKVPGHVGGTYDGRQRQMYPPVGSYGAWVQPGVTTHVPSGVPGGVPIGIPAGMNAMNTMQSIQSIQGMAPYVHHGMQPAGTYAMNAPHGYQGQAPYMPTMMYMVPHIAPRLAPPFIERSKSASGSRGNSRSPKRGVAQHQTGTERGSVKSEQVWEGDTSEHNEAGQMYQDGDKKEKKTTSPMAREEDARQDGSGPVGLEGDAGSPLRTMASTRTSGSTMISNSSHSPTHGSTKKPCAFFLQHGSCAFGSKCKFSHPIELAPVVEYNSVGLPRRYGKPVCRYYVQTGRCSYGYTCKYDHPDLGGI